MLNFQFYLKKKKAFLQEAKYNKRHLIYIFIL